MKVSSEAGATEGVVGRSARVKLAPSVLKTLPMMLYASSLKANVSPMLRAGKHTESYE